MSSAAHKTPVSVFLTGATGFLGKVVLEELLRRRRELRLTRVFLLIRPRGSQLASQRYIKSVQHSACLAGLPPGWEPLVEVVSGDLAKVQCGIDADQFAQLRAEVTHIIHCAASVDFDLPVQKAAIANINSCMHALELAKGCPRLQRMVSVSTAYVTPHRLGPIEEVLAPLPRPAQELLAEIEAGSISDAELLAITGHPNTYTLTKCLAEHLLSERRQNVPLSIVRPSIIAAAWRLPSPGWIDSNAALASFVSAIGTGMLRVMDGERRTQLDVVPVDEVAHRIIDEAMRLRPVSAELPIVHATAGLAHTGSIAAWSGTIENYFRRYPVLRRPWLKYVGPRGPSYHLWRALLHQGPAWAAKTAYALQRNEPMRRRAGRATQKLDYINQVFPYFTNRSFDFISSAPLSDGFEVPAYLETTCEGVHHYLLKRDPYRVVLAGAASPGRRSDALWASLRPRGNLAIRASAALLTKALRRMFDVVTFDQRSFERAMATVEPGQQVVLVPTHRSYMDFLLCSYLFFARPDLGIAIPHIAAAHEFSQIPGIGWLFRQMHAFYIRRGNGRPDPELTAQVQRLVREGDTLQFFIEGKRSRGRRFLKPRRGILRCLQGTGLPFVVLPVAISYDRVPEERALLGELMGQPKEKMRLASLLRWSRQLLRGEVRLGTVHVRCGAVVPFGPRDDAHAVGNAIMGALQAATVATTYHLRSFIAAEAPAGPELAWLRRAIGRRGGRVIDSAFAPAEALDPVLERSLRQQWAHLFLPEACHLQPHNPALTHHRRESLFMQPLQPELAPADEAPLRLLLAQLYAPLCADYAAVARGARRFAGKPHQAISVEVLLRQAGVQDPAVGAAALRALAERGSLSWADLQHVHILARPADLTAFAEQCAWSTEAHRQPVAAVRAVS